MLKTMIALMLLTIWLIPSQADAARHKYSKEIGDYVEPPKDSANAENLRIWFPIERDTYGRVTVEILNDSAQVIRHFLDIALSRGYFNIYWDKKDDSGRWVEPGEYRYEVTDRGRLRPGLLTVSYQPFERAVLLYNEGWREPGLVRYDILADSVKVSAGLYHWRGGRIELHLSDSIMYKGSYEYHWPVEQSVRKGKYRFHLEAGGITHKVRISRIKLPKN